MTFAKIENTVTQSTITYRLGINIIENILGEERTKVWRLFSFFMVFPFTPYFQTRYGASEYDYSYNEVGYDDYYDYQVFMNKTNFTYVKILHSLYHLSS